VVLAQSGADPVAEGGHALGQCLGERHPGQQVERRLLGQLGEETAELLERGGPPVPAVRVDPEVEPRGGQRRVGHPVRHGGLHGDVLEVDGPAVEQQRLLAVVDRDLAQGRVQWAEPEGLSGPVVGKPAVAQVAHVGRGVRPQVTDETEPADVGHQLLLTN